MTQVTYVDQYGHFASGCKMLHKTILLSLLDKVNDLCDRVASLAAFPSNSLVQFSSLHFGRAETKLVLVKV